MSEPFEAIPREKFLADRRASIDAAKLQQIHMGASFIVMEPEDDEVICDICNAEIEEPMIWLNSYGAYCLTCRRGARAGNGHE